MRKIAKATATVSTVTFSNVLVGLVRSKFTAIMLGTSGVGLFSQALNFLQFAIAISSLSMRFGVTKCVSKYSAEKEDMKVAETISFSTIMQVMAAIFLILLIAVFSGTASKYLFASEKYRFFVFLLSLSIPLVVLSGTFESVLLGFGDYRNFAKGRVLATFLSLVPLFVFIGFMKINGAFIYLLANSFIAFLVFYYIMRKNMPQGIYEKVVDIKGMYLKRSDFSSFSRTLLSYGGTSFIAGGLTLFTVVFLRTLVINCFGLDANGLYQVVFAISTYYLALFTNGLWSYFYPKVSSISDPKDYSFEINAAMRFCLLGMTPFVIGIYLFRYPIIHILFTNRFLPSEELFSTQLLGDVFFLVFYIFGTSLLASGRLKSYLAIGLIYNASFLFMFISLSNYLGLKAVTVSYLISNFFIAVALGVYHIKFLKIEIYAKNIALFAITALLCSAVMFLGNASLLNAIYKTCLSFLCLYLVVTREEKAKIAAFAASKLRILSRHG